MRIILKKNSSQGVAPNPSELELGELAINTFDGKLYTKTYNNVQEQIVEIGGDKNISDLNDVDTSGAVAGQVLRWDGSYWSPTDDRDTTYIPGTGISIDQVDNSINLNATLDLLTDVNTAGVTIGQVLKWDGTSWSPAADEQGTTINSLNDIGDVNAPSPGDNDILLWNGDKGEWNSGSLPTYIEPTGLEKVTDNGTNYGWRLVGSAINGNIIGERSIDFTTQNLATGDYSFAVGSNAYAEGMMSFSSGYLTYATGNYSRAFGIYARANGNYSTAIGSSVQADGNYSVALGQGTIAQNEASHAEGKYNIGTSPETLYEFGIGNAYNDRKNAFEIYGDGRITAPELTIPLIDAETTGRVLATKEWVQANTGGGGNLLSDGSVPMDVGYMPINDQDIATKYYVDNRNIDGGIF